MRASSCLCGGKAVRSPTTTITDAQWATVRATLPSAFKERDWFRNHLEHILRDQPEERTRAEECIRRADQCAQLSRQLPDDPALRDLLATRERRDREKAAFYLQLANRPRRLRLKFEFLLLWQAAGGKLPISLRSPAVRYFQAVSMIAFSKEPKGKEAQRIISRFRHARGRLIVDESGITVIKGRA